MAGNVCDGCIGDGKIGTKTCPFCNGKGSTRAQRAAARQAETARVTRVAEDRVLAGAARLDPGDTSLTARQIRETAASIRDHRESTARRAGG